MSRFAALRAITEQGELNIDEYRHWTIDWSKAPNGHYYSNKAPGSFLLVLPEFWLIDNIALIWDWDNKEQSGIRGAPGHFQKTMLSFLGQVIPLLILLYFICQFFTTRGYSSVSVQWMMAAVLFGSTAAIFMNNWFGHGFAAILYLLSILLLMEGWAFGLGLSLSALVLSDYSAVLFIFPFIAAMFLLKQVTNRRALSFCFGVLPCFAIWVWYHEAAFGSFLKIATMYLNPAMQDMNKASSMFGVVGFWPRAHALYELLLGGTRGVLVTQPWTLVLIGYALYLAIKRQLNRQEIVLAGLIGTNLVLLYLFNSSVGAWHGGFTAGPRYMTTALLGVALIIPLVWNKLAWHGKWLIGVTVIYAIVFRAFVYGTTILAPPQELWPWMIGEFAKTTSGTPYLRTGVFIILVLLAAWRVKKIEQSKA